MKYFRKEYKNVLENALLYYQEQFFDPIFYETITPVEYLSKRQEKLTNNPLDRDLSKMFDRINTILKELYLLRSYHDWGKEYNFQDLFSTVYGDIIRAALTFYKKKLNKYMIKLKVRMGDNDLVFPITENEIKLIEDIQQGVIDVE